MEKWNLSNLGNIASITIQWVQGQIQDIILDNVTTDYIHSMMMTNEL